MLSLTCGCTDVTLSKKRLCFCRPASAEGGAGSSEPAGLYWRKHRLVVPAAYAMTEEAAQSAAPHSPTAAQQDSPDGSKTPTLPAASLEVTCAVLPEAVAESASADALEESDVCSSSSASLPLVIDDAAELTHDSAAAILRQLSYECQTAGLHATVTAHTNSGVSTPNMQLLCGDQEVLVTASHGAATASGLAPAASHAPADASVSMTWPSEHDSTPEQIRHCPQPDEVEEGVTSEPSAVNASVQQYANDTAVDQRVDATSESLADTSSEDVTCCQPGLGSNGQLAKDSAQQAAPGQRAAVHQAAVAESPFLQRLRMSKQAGSSAPAAAAALQPPLSMQGQLELVCIHCVLPTTTKQSA